ncbi:hypothetical protein F9K33_03265 [bacterium]|nr:MAG: hypothetical protein F9K33_03265 [bacterium]
MHQEFRNPTPGNPAHKLYEEYFVPDSRGYQFIRNFHSKYIRELSRTEFEDFDAFLNQIFVNLTKIVFAHIEGPQEHYVIKAMYYQCWNIIYRLKRERKIMVLESAGTVFSEDSPGESPITLQKSDTADPLESTEAADLFELITTFKTRLKNDDIRILNGLIDQKELGSLANELQLEYNALCVKIKRLRGKLALFLKKLGYQDRTTLRYLKKNKNIL